MIAELVIIIRCTHPHAKMVRLAFLYWDDRLHDLPAFAASFVKSAWSHQALRNLSWSLIRLHQGRPQRITFPHVFVLLSLP